MTLGMLHICFMPCIFHLTIIMNFPYINIYCPLDKRAIEIP